MSTAIEKIKAPFTEPQMLNSIFVKSPNGELYEIPTAVAATFLVSKERLGELGHPPLPVALSKEEEVAGHHKVPGGDATNAGGWGYHLTWEYGCYYDSLRDGYAVGFHRHPNGDESAIGASASDFS